MRADLIEAGLNEGAVGGCGDLWRLLSGGDRRGRASAADRRGRWLWPSMTCSGRAGASDVLGGCADPRNVLRAAQRRGSAVGAEAVDDAGR